MAQPPPPKIWASIPPPGAPLTYFHDWGGEGVGGSPKDVFGSEILAKKDFLGLEFFGYCTFHWLKSTIT